MARAFECTLDEFFAVRPKNVIPITAQCTVFAEARSSAGGRGQARDEIAAGIQQSGPRCFVMAKKAGAKDHITLTGGCAKTKV